MKKERLRICSFVLLCFLSCSSAFSKNLQLDQTEILGKIKTYTNSLFVDKKRGSKASPFLSTVIANLSKIEDQKLEKYGFKTRYFENDAGLITKIQVKYDGTVKPLLVFVSGLSGGSQSPSFKRYAMPLALENKYHIVLVENPTNKNWIHRNQNILFTGFEAGLNLYMICENIKDYVSHYTTLSLVAFSLGGHDSAYAAYLDTLQGRNIINGSLLFWSSPIDKLTAIKQLRSKRHQYKLIVKVMLHPLYNVLSSFDKNFSEKSFKWFVHKGAFTEVLGNFLGNTLVKKNLFVKQVKERGIRIDPTTPLCQLLPHLNKPMLWIHAKNDPIVHRHVTKKCLASLSNQKNLAYLEARYGGHLGQVYVYGGKLIKKIEDDYLMYWNGKRE